MFLIRILSFLIASCAFVLNSFAQAGLHDVNFGQNGLAFTRVDTFSEMPLKTKINAAGELYSVGLYNPYNVSQYDAFFVTKHLANGQPDLNFAQQGIFKDSFPQRGLMMDLIVNNDGSVLAAGGTTNNPSHPLLIKLKPNGTYDSTFGNNGHVLITNHVGNILITDLILQSDGKIVAGISFYDGNTNYDFGIMRLLSNGQLDAAFGLNGLSILSIPAHYELLQGVQQGADGSFILVGKQYDSYDQSHGFLVKLKSNGNVETTFGNNGTVDINVNLPNTFCDLNDVKIQPDGKIVCCGFTIENLGGPSSYENHFLVTRHLPNGQVDATFGNQGKVISDVYTGSENATCLTLQPDGNIVVGGNTGEPFPAFQSLIAVVRYKNNGDYDSTFGLQGVVVENVSNTEGNGVNDIHFTPDGGLLITGSCYEDNWTGFLNCFYSKYRSGVPLGIENVEDIVNSVTLYPNPCDQTLFVASHSKKLFNGQILDIQGRTVLNFNQTNHMQLDKLPNGYYLIRFEEKNARAIPFQVRHKE